MDAAAAAAGSFYSKDSYAPCSYFKTKVKCQQKKAQHNKSSATLMKRLSKLKKSMSMPARRSQIHKLAQRLQSDVEI